ncbi:alpha/beta hydrolase [Nordella sp. HKS 07]|uniref:alpha/beta fold hydrolase n=1 Tax=Nordella sp. HKS 07 TaxID=2712222 RepID=UPI0013E1EDD4|nr:alpha/beta hydrolase [Nordella sp. HKS 07]QIG50221.1 alpha/beta hydrolase [Nordella sp. HKS 07]
MNGYREYFVDLGDGNGLSCAERGSPDGPPLILVHGYGDSWRSYRPVIEELPPTIRAVAISLRGHGDSSKPESRYDMAEFTGDIVGAMDRLAIERAVIVGHSMGSLVAQCIAMDHPERVTGLVLIGSLPTVADHPGVEEMWRDSVAGLEDPVDPEFVRSFQESTLAQPVPGTFFDGILFESAKVPARVWRGALRSMLSEDRSDRLHRIVAPTLIVWGDRDNICSREHQDLLLRGIPRARLSVYEGAGHGPHWENPKPIAAEIIALHGDTLRETV